MIRYSSITAKILIIFAWQIDSIFKIIYTQTECNVTPIEILESRIFFIVLAVSLAIWSLKDKGNFFEFVFMEFAFYNVFDELMGLGSSYQWYELPIFLITLTLTYRKFKIERK